MNIYVGGLPFSSTQEELEQLFGAHGTVEAVNIVKDKFTDKSRGFAFVEMNDKSEAIAAINAINGTMLSGRELKVNEARPREDRKGGGGGGGGSRRRY